MSGMATRAEQLLERAKQIRETEEQRRLAEEQRLKLEQEEKGRQEQERERKEIEEKEREKIEARLFWEKLGVLPLLEELQLSMESSKLSIGKLVKLSKLNDLHFSKWDSHEFYNQVNKNYYSVEPCVLHWEDNDWKISIVAEYIPKASPYIETYTDNSILSLIIPFGLGLDFREKKRVVFRANKRPGLNINGSVVGKDGNIEDLIAQALSNRVSKKKDGRMGSESSYGGNSPYDDNYWPPDYPGGR